MFTSFESFGSYFNSVNLYPKVLLTVKEFVQFQSTYLRESNVKVDLSYLISAYKVVIFIDEQGEWYGGYVINTGNMRYAQLIDSAQLPALEKASGVKMEECVEIACIWKRKDGNGVPPASFLKVYYFAIKNCVESKKTFVLGGSVNPSILKSFKRALDKVFYQGTFHINGKTLEGTIVYNDREGVQEAFTHYMSRMLPLLERV